jgi:hypothetical protein
MRLLFLYEFHIHGQNVFSFSNIVVLKNWKIIQKFANCLTHIKNQKIPILSNHFGSLNAKIHPIKI